MELTLIRHGRSLADDEARVEGGGWDAPLTAEGVRQANLLAERLVDEGYACDVLYSSPLLRAMAVAEILAAAIGRSEVTQDPRLAELDLGRLSGLLISQAQERYPKPPGGVPLWSPYLEGQWFRFRSGDTGVHRLTIQGQSVITHYLNDTSHLR